MARIVSILLLGIFTLSYTAFSVRHSLPYLHYNLNKEYVAKNLCVNKDLPESTCQGKCYLKDQLKKSVTQENGTESSQNNLQFEIFLEEYHSKDLSAPVLQVLSSGLISKLFFLPSILLEISSPPPNS